MVQMAAVSSAGTVEIELGGVAGKVCDIAAAAAAA